MGRTTIFLAAAGLTVLTACTGESTATSTTEAEPVGPVAGRIVILDSEANIVTMDFDGSNQVPLTDDGGSTQYFQPVWSADGRVVAWGEGGNDGFAVGLANDDGTNRRAIPVGGFPFYLNWSPDGVRIGILHNGNDGDIEFEIVDVVAGSASVTDSGSPYYFSWSPDGKALVVHVGGSRLEILDESASPSSLGVATSNFLAPQWTEEGIFYFGPRGLVLRRADDDQVVLVDAQGFVSINPNPNGDVVALHVLSGDSQGVTVALSTQENAETNAVTIIEVVSGAIETVAGQTPIASFWSPDGTRLLILELSGEQGLVDVSMWENGSVEVVDTISLPPSLISQVLPFLDQYTQSLQVWSPDSRSFVLPAARDGEAGIWVYDSVSFDPVMVSDGSWASWSDE